MCPQFTCRAIVFFARVNDELITFPPEVLEIDTVDLPPVVAESLREAVACHAAAAYRAAAIMLRRSVEAMCDERGAKGPTLKERLKVLRSKVILPEELFDAVEELRLLGNDGAHVTARQFDDVGREEVEAALPLVREVLKAVYQYKALLRGLQARKKPAT